MFDKSLLIEAEAVLGMCKKHGLKLTTAESCTAGLLTALLTEIPGTSKVLEGGFVTYSNEAKTKLIGVDAQLIKEHGAVSELVAIAMAKGAKEKLKADLAASITGVAGPDGGTTEKPVGMVCVAVAAGDKMSVKTHYFSGDRQAIRLQSVEAAVEMLKEAVTHSFVSVA